MYKWLSNFIFTSTVLQTHRIYLLHYSTSFNHFWLTDQSVWQYDHFVYFHTNLQIFLLFCGLTQTKVSSMSINVFLIVWHEINPYRFGMTRGILSANHVKVYRSLIGSRHMSVWRCVSNCFSNSMKHLYNRAALHWEYMLLLEDQYVQ